MARGLLGRNSNLHIRQRRRDALKEADLVILAGMVSNNKRNMLKIRKLCVIKLLMLIHSVLCSFRKVHVHR